jgi:hypothetical protein
MTPTHSTGDHIYKGKHTNRSWQQLPAELIRYVRVIAYRIRLFTIKRVVNSFHERHIATLYIKDVVAHLYCPVTWEVREVWPSRMVYVALCQAIELEKLMNVTPSWFTARAFTALYLIILTHSCT